MNELIPINMSDPKRIMENLRVAFFYFDSRNRNYVLAFDLS